MNPRFILALATLLLPAALAAQFPIRVRVVDDASQRPLAGALASAVGGPAGVAALPASIVAQDGMATVRVPAAGVYRILVRRIGYAPFTSDSVRVTGTSSIAITIAVPSTRIALTAVRVTATRECDANGMSTSSEAAPLWNEVRTALETSILSRGTSFIVMNGVSVRRTLGEDGRLISEDTTSKGTAGARPFSAEDPAFLARSGYVQGGYKTSMTFNAPDEQVLLSDGFKRMHCLSLASSVRRSGDTTLIGLAFEPRTNNQLAEIQGTLWVDSATSELRRLEYTYVRAPLPFTVAGLGGFVDFRRHRSGAWYVSSWSIRMPRWRPSNMHPTGVALAGFAEAGGAAFGVRESEALPANQVRAITGNVFDSLSTRDLPGAVVSIPALGRSTTTDFLGRFRFDSVAIGTWGVVAEYEPLAGTGITKIEGMADVVGVQRADLSLAVPSFATLWKKACGGRPVPDGSGGFVMGTVRTPTGAAVPNATVEFKWKQFPRDSVITLCVSADTAGKYLTCVGSGSGVTVRAFVDSLSSVPVTFAFVPAHVAERNVVFANDEQAEAVSVDSLRILDALASDAGGVVGGTVRDPSGRGISAGRVRLLDVVGQARVAANGAFAYRGVPPGLHVVSIEAIGYERARRMILVGAGDSAHVDVRLGRLSTLATVTVKEAARLHSLRLEINDRVSSAHGYMIDSLKLAKVAFMYQAFNIPAARIRTQGTRFTMEFQQLGFTIAADNPESYCVPTVYIDDVPLGFDVFSELPKESIGLIEIYSRVANAPMKYTGTGSLSGATTTVAAGGGGRSKAAGVVKSACGVVLVWTKNFLKAGDMGGKQTPPSPAPPKKP